jgi:Spy/CpxP family protein refolding chaperone
VVNTRARGAAVLVAVFALGAVAGGGGTYAWLRRDDAAGSDDDRVARGPRRLRALERALDLTPAQRERVGAIMVQSGEQRRQLAQEMYERCGDGLRARHDAVSAQIRALLTPAQQARFDVIAARQRERFPFGGPMHGAAEGWRRGPRGE